EMLAGRATSRCQHRRSDVCAGGGASCSNASAVGVGGAGSEGTVEWSGAGPQYSGGCRGASGGVDAGVGCGAVAVEVPVEERCSDCDGAGVRERTAGDGRTASADGEPVVVSD